MSTSVTGDAAPQVVITEVATNVVVLQMPAAPAVVQVAVEGPQGPAGSAVSYTHTQASAASTWTINHNLGFRPSVELLSTGSQEIEGDVVHTSTNQTVVTFTSAVAGFARLN